MSCSISHCGAQDDDVGKVLFVVALQKVESEDSLATPHCLTYNHRVGVLGEDTVNRLH